MIKKFITFGLEVSQEYLSLLASYEKMERSFDTAKTLYESEKEQLEVIADNLELERNTAREQLKRYSRREQQPGPTREPTPGMITEKKGLKLPDPNKFGDGNTNEYDIWESNLWAKLSEALTNALTYYT